MICPRLGLVKIWHERSEGSERRRRERRRKTGREDERTQVPRTRTGSLGWYVVWRMWVRNAHHPPNQYDQRHGIHPHTSYQEQLNINTQSLDRRGEEEPITRPSQVHWLQTRRLPLLLAENQADRRGWISKICFSPDSGMSLFQSFTSDGVRTEVRKVVGEVGSEGMPREAAVIHEVSIFMIPIRIHLAHHLTFLCAGRQVLQLQLAWFLVIMLIRTSSSFGYFGFLSGHWSCSHSLTSHR